ncbi:hypothetical protein P8452_57141 [Trifolium repens]|nr:hypothetical protein P8452_57141 [Trifolium repens]
MEDTEMCALALHLEKTNLTFFYYMGIIKMHVVFERSSLFILLDSLLTSIFLSFLDSKYCLRACYMSLI